MKMTFVKFYGSASFGVRRGGRDFGTLSLTDVDSMSWSLIVEAPKFYAGRYVLNGDYKVVTNYISKHFGSAVR